MRRIRGIGLALVAVFAIGALAAESASAAAPEFGVCKQEATATHVYKNANCTKVSSGSSTGKYEWYPGASGGSSVKGTTPVTIQLEPSGSNDRIKCAGSIGEDQYTGPKTLDMVLIFDGCQFGGHVCKSGGDNAGDIVTEGWAEGELQVYKTNNNPVKDKVALVLEPQNGGLFFAPFTCGTETFEVEGEVMVPVKTNVMQQTSTLAFKETGGVQDPNDGGFYTLETEVNSGPYEETGLKFTVEDTADEAYEVNTIA